MPREGKCCRTLVACSRARAASPSTTRPSKLSSKRTEIASANDRTMRVSTPASISMTDKTRSWKTGSAFRMRSLVSTTTKFSVETIKAGTLPAVSKRHLFAKISLFGGRGVVFGRNFVGSPEMDLGNLSQYCRSFCLHELCRGLLYFSRHAAAQPYPYCLSFPLQPIDERFARR